MGFSLLGGFNAMGGAIAQTAGVAALEIQRGELEKDKIALAEMLAEGRETRGREQQAAINDKTLDKTQSFQAGESLLNRNFQKEIHEDTETHADTRSANELKSAEKRAAMSEGAANSRFDKQMQLQIDQAKQAVTDKKEQRALESAIAASTSTVMEEYTTTGGDKATRPVKNFDPDKAASILSKAGYADLAAPFKAPEKPAPKFTEGQIVLQNGVQYQYKSGKFVPLNK